MFARWVISVAWSLWLKYFFYQLSVNHLFVYINYDDLDAILTINWKCKNMRKRHEICCDWLSVCYNKTWLRIYSYCLPAEQVYRDKYDVINWDFLLVYMVLINIQMVVKGQITPKRLKSTKCRIYIGRILFHFQLIWCAFNVLQLSLTPTWYMERLSF